MKLHRDLGVARLPPTKQQLAEGGEKLRDGEGEKEKTCRCHCKGMSLVERERKEPAFPALTCVLNFKAMCFYVLRDTLRVNPCNKALCYISLIVSGVISKSVSDNICQVTTVTLSVKQWNPLNSIINQKQPS